MVGAMEYTLVLTTRTGGSRVWSCSARLFRVSRPASRFSMELPGCVRPREVWLNFGLLWDLSTTHHIIFSARPAIEGTNQLQGYFGYLRPLHLAEPHRKAQQQ